MTNIALNDRDSSLYMPELQEKNMEKVTKIYPFS